MKYAERHSDNFGLQKYECFSRLFSSKMFNFLPYPTPPPPPPQKKKKKLKKKRKVKIL